MSAEKKRKVDDDRACASSDSEPDQFDKFTMVKVLSDNTQQKTLFVHGRFEGREGDAVLLLEKTPFSEQTLGDLLDGTAKLALTMHNDIYKTYELQPRNELNTIKLTLVHPATEKHIDKFSAQDTFLVEESPEDYRRITLPFIEESALSAKWVENVLEGRSEVERVVLRDDASPSTGFVLLPDMKWDGKQTNDLYLVALPLDRSLRSLRDLRAEHLPLLENIRDKGCAAIFARYGVPSARLGIYFHYSPSYYHLHVHFSHLSSDAFGTRAGKAHFLSDVIDNIRLISDYYARCTIVCLLRGNEALYLRFACAREAVCDAGDGAKSV